MFGCLRIAPLALVIMALPATAGETVAQQAPDPLFASSTIDKGAFPSAAAQAVLESDPIEDMAERRRGFETTGFAQFLASPAGRLLRGAVGVAMIGGGIAWGDTEGTALAISGAIPLSAAVLDLCYVSALMGGPIRGEDIRAAGR